MRITILGLLLTCFTAAAFCQSNVPKDSHLEMGKGYDTVMVIDTLTSEYSMRISDRPVPVKYQGYDVYNSADSVIRPKYKGHYKSFYDELMHYLLPELSQLPDGYYVLDLSCLTLDQTGKIIYYSYFSLVPVYYHKTDTFIQEQTADNGNIHKVRYIEDYGKRASRKSGKIVSYFTRKYAIPEAIDSAIDDKIDKFMAAKTYFTPAIYNNKDKMKVPYILNELTYDFKIPVEIKKGKIAKG